MQTDEQIGERLWLTSGESRIPIDVVDMPQALRAVLDSNRDGWRYVVTPNLHHLDLVRSKPRLAELYTNAALSLPDGWPVAWLAGRVLGAKVRRVAGSDLFDSIIGSEGRGRPLAFVGGSPGVGMRSLLAHAESRGWRPFVEFAPRSDLVDTGRRRQLMERIAAGASGGIVVIGVGAPRQEVFAREMSTLPGHGMILCLGMSINFGTGDVRRAPSLVQAARLEWAFRAMQEPTRLGPRYIRDARALVPLTRQNRRGTA